MSTTTSDDAPHPYAERPTVADNGFIRPSGTPLSTPYLDGPTPAQRAERAPWRAEAAVEMLSTAFLHRPAALPLIREVYTPLILLATGIQILARTDDDPATGSLLLLIALVPVALITLYISYWQWKSARAHVRAAVAWSRSAPAPSHPRARHGGSWESLAGTGPREADDVVGPGALPAVGQWMRTTLPRRLPGLAWAAAAPAVMTTLARACAPAPYWDAVGSAGIALVAGMVGGGLISNLVLSARLGRARAAVGLTGLETGAWTLIQRFTDDPAVLPEGEAAVPRTGPARTRFAEGSTRPNRSGLVNVTLLDARVALLPKAADDIAGSGAPQASPYSGGVGSGAAGGGEARTRRALADLLESARAVARQGQRVFDVGMVLTAALMLYAGARPWATGDALAWRTAPMVVSAAAALAGVAILGAELYGVIDGATTEQLHLRALRAWARSRGHHTAAGWAAPAWAQAGPGRSRRQPARTGRWGMGLWVLILLVAGVLTVAWTAGETPVSLGRSIGSLSLGTLRSWGLGDIELGLLCVVGLSTWVLTVAGRLRWGRQIRGLEEALLAGGVARVGLDGRVVVNEGEAPVSALPGAGRGSTAILEVPDDALVAGPWAWARDASATRSGSATPWECGVAVERLSHLAAERRRSSRGGWMPLHAGLLLLVVAVARLGAGRGWILGVLAAVLGGVMVVSGTLSALRDIAYDARVRRALLSWAGEARGPWAWPEARGRDGGGALAAWWAVDGAIKPVSFLVIMGETAVLWWLLAPAGGAPALPGAAVLALPLLTWLISLVRLAPLAVGARRARAAVGLPGLWQVQDCVSAGEYGTTTVPGWRTLGAPVPVAADAFVPAAPGMPASVEAGGHWGRGR